MSRDGAPWFGREWVRFEREYGRPPDVRLHAFARLDYDTVVAACGKRGPTGTHYGSDELAEYVTRDGIDLSPERCRKCLKEVGQ